MILGFCIYLRFEFSGCKTIKGGFVHISIRHLPILQTKEIPTAASRHNQTENDPKGSRGVSSLYGSTGSNRRRPWIQHTTLLKEYREQERKQLIKSKQVILNNNKTSA